MSKTYIVTNYFKKTDFSNDDFIIGVDIGCKFLLEAGVIPHVVLGDFDSIPEKLFKQLPDTTQIMRYNPMKAKSDTELAFDFCHANNMKNIVLYNSLEGRFGHVAGIISNMIYAYKLQLNVTLRSNDSELFLIDSFKDLSGYKAKFVSLYALLGDAKGVYLKGFKYPLDNGEIPLFTCLGLSNEFVDEVRTIEVQDGLLLCIIES